MTKVYNSTKEEMQRQLSAFRRKACKQSILKFAQTYLPAHYKYAPSSMHLQLFEDLQKATVERGVHLAIAAPRGHAKSTIVSHTYILWCICYHTEPYIMLISNTLDLSSDFLSLIKRELQSNIRLLEDFPDVCEPLGSQTGAPRWRQAEIITRNGVKVTALGAEKQIRGRRHNQHRPTLIVLDDVENETEVRSAEQRKHKEQWFNKAVLKVGTSQSNFIVVGTILHYDALLANLIDRSKSPNWTGKKFQAVCKWSSHTELWSKWESIYCHREEFEGAQGPKAARTYFKNNKRVMLKGTKVLWGELEDYYALMELRISEGRASFDSEKQNEPVNPEDCYFQESDFQFWDDEYSSVEALIGSMRGRHSFYGACDPSMGKQGKGSDDTAIITLLRDDLSGMLYVIDADIKRRKPDAIIDDIIRFHRLRGYQRFVMEINQFQEFLSDVLKKRSRELGVYVPVYNRRNTSDKEGRIQSLQPHISSGTIRFSRRHITLVDQLRQFPMGAHDDGPDALEMALSAAKRGSNSCDKIVRIPNPTIRLFEDPRHLELARQLHGM
ncbi:MAG: phage terminase large subunit [Planctomycetes bacterium]|nr:phage terminase large subunit [Planctomycetota bacterium]